MIPDEIRTTAVSGYANVNIPVPKELTLRDKVGLMNEHAESMRAKVENLCGAVGLPLFPTDGQEPSDSLIGRLERLGQTLGVVNDYLGQLQSRI